MCGEFCSHCIIIPMQAGLNTVQDVDVHILSTETAIWKSAESEAARRNIRRPTICRPRGRPASSLHSAPDHISDPLESFLGLKNDSTSAVV